MQPRHVKLDTVSSSARSIVVAVVIAIVGLASAVTAYTLFPRALPLLALEERISRDDALARADSFFTAYSLAPAGARTAVRFEGNDSLRTFVELAGGGTDSLNALIRGRDAAPFIWSVRAWVAGRVQEARVDFAPDGRIVGFDRRLADADRRPGLSPDSARRMADEVMSGWIGVRLDQWRLLTSSYQTRKASGRVDRTFTYERTDRRIAQAPLRLDVMIAGDMPSLARPYVVVPDSFRRRYAEMRSSNELLALLASAGMIIVVVLGTASLYLGARRQQVRWREPMFVGSVIGVLTFAAGLNEMPASWFGYDTATSPLAFQTGMFLVALAAGVGTALMAGFTLAAAESATRRAFPDQLDWWKLWKYRGTREVASQVAGGYVVAAMGLAYVVLFYLITRRFLGWWVPSELLDDPNQIASPMPWISGIAISLNAGVWEEALFRALPLSLLSLWVGRRAHRGWWMAGGVVVSALIFGFAHANYDSWPPYSRGVEIFIDACFWGFLVLRFGVLVTIVAHFLYDLVLFGMFTASGSATESRISAFIITAAILSPAIAVGWRLVRQRGFIATPADARFGAWVPREAGESVAAPMAVRTTMLSSRALRLAYGAVALATLVALARAPRPPLGPPFTADRAQIMRSADSLLRINGGNPAEWRKLTTSAADTLTQWPRFLREHDMVPRAQRFASSYLPAAWWTVRFVKSDGTPAHRAEEWRIRLWPDGRPLDIRHIIADSARRDSVSTEQARGIARAALARAGIDTLRLQEAELEETARPARRDMSISYIDTTVTMPQGASARAWVTMAGAEPLLVRRGVELPESFLRADRQRQTNRALISGSSMAALMILVIIGAILVKRRRAVIVDDGHLDRRTVIVLIAGLSALIILGQLNDLPSRLFSYDTSEPWSSFIGSTVVSTLFGASLSLFSVAIWLALGALRRRAGIPMLPGAPSGETSRNIVVGGLGLGAICFVGSRLNAVVAREVMPSAAVTTLNSIFPVLSRAVDVVTTPIVLVAVFGIPLLAVVAFSPRWQVRAVIAALAASLVLVAVTAQAPTGGVSAVGAMMGGVSVLLIAIGLWLWGSTSWWTWIVAAIALGAFGALRDAAYAPTRVEQAAALVALAIGVGLIALVARHARDGWPRNTSRWTSP